MFLRLLLFHVEQPVINVSRERFVKKIKILNLRTINKNNLVVS
jgi:hypothetical protein